MDNEIKDDEVMNEEIVEEEVIEYTVEELIIYTKERMASAETAEEFNIYAETLDRLLHMDDDERIKIESLELQKQQIEATKKANKIPIIAAIITAVGAVAGTIIGKTLDYNADMEYLDRSVEHEKTDNVLRNDRKQRRPKHSKDGK